jgi:hypothetical protein
MAKKEFSPETKEKVRIAANFRCCLCRERFCFHTHHIDSEKNDFENAIPLCETCHSYFGEDNSKQKFLIQARDDWYKQVIDNRGSSEQKFFEDIYRRIENFDEKPISKESLTNDIVSITSNNISTVKGDIKNYYQNGDIDNTLEKVKYLASSMSYSADILKNIYGIENDKTIKSINDIYQMGSEIKDDRCPFCKYDLTQLFYIPDGKCPNCNRHIWYNLK